MMGADVGFYIPERESEGYGLNRGALKKLADEGTQLIVTVDNGISALDEADYAKALGMDLVITDHHQPGDVLPDAVAVVDPHRRDDTSAYRDQMCIRDRTGADRALIKRKGVFLMDKILKLLEENARYTNEEIAVMTQKTPEEVAETCLLYTSRCV